MTAHKPATKRKAGERVYPGPKPRLKLLKPGSECSTLELASGLPEELLSAPRRLNRNRKAADVLAARRVARPASSDALTFFSSSSGSAASSRSRCTRR